MLFVVAGYLLDLVVGDPRQFPHPVVIIGKGIDFLEKHLRKWAASVVGLRLAGVFLTLLVVISSYAVMLALLEISDLLGYWISLIVGIWFMNTTIAVKGLKDSAMEIYRLLEAEDLENARLKVGWIVGRDTGGLDESEITRATVETVAENIVDGIVAPLFYGFIGGVPLAMAYKAVNTLDSMVGYKNEKYREFGWASARFDDLCNFIPARITGFLLLAAFVILRKPVSKAISVIKRDSAKHPSPNSGIPEAAVAGALGVQLGGINYYNGLKSFRAHMGDPINKLEKSHIVEAVKIMQVTAFLAVATGVAVNFIIIKLF